MKLVLPDPRNPVTIKTGIFGFIGKIFLFNLKLNQSVFGLLIKVKSFQTKNHFRFYFFFFSDVLLNSKLNSNLIKTDGVKFN